VSPAWSWSAPGHQAIAETAQGHLNDRAKSALAAVLFDTDTLPPAALASVATWPDDIRHGFPKTWTQEQRKEASHFNQDHPGNAGWHFVNLPLGASEYPTDSLADDDPLNKSEPGAQYCTDIGCGNGFYVTIRPHAGDFPSGTHEVVIIAEGSPVRICTFNIPFAGSVESGVCDGGDIRLWVTRRFSQSDAPILGEFEERLGIRGLPAKVRVTQRTLEGGTYLDREATPAYVDFFPNGKECGAVVCKQDSATWEF